MVHAIRIQAGPVNSRQAADNLQRQIDRLDGSRVFQPREVEVSMAWTKEDEQGERMIVALMYFDGDTVTKADLLDAIESLLLGSRLWYRVSHHDCDLGLPGGQRSGCSPWSLERSGGGVPTDQEMWR